MSSLYDLFPVPGTVVMEEDCRILLNIPVQGALATLIYNSDPRIRAGLYWILTSVPVPVRGST